MELIENVQVRGACVDVGPLKALENNQWQQLQLELR
jgi:hypothetical protein